MEVSILVCDDLPEERFRMSRMLESYERSHGVELRIETASDGAELLALWKPGRWDIIFLDVYMPEMNGIEAARRLRKVDKNCEIVLATTSREHGVEGYELRALDYLTKPFTRQDVDGAMDWFIQQRAEKLHELTVRTQWGEQAVRTQDIQYVESRGHSCIVHTEGEEYSVRGSIDEISADLDGTSFFRCHQSFLLNFAHVASIGKRAFLMDDGERVPISAANVSRSKAALLKWNAEQIWGKE